MQNRRIFFVGLNTGYATAGEPDDRLIEFYRRRSSALLYCAIVGNVVIPGGYGSNETCSIITKSPTWAALASAMAQRGTLPGIQLATAWKNYKGPRAFKSKDSRAVIANARKIVSNISDKELDQLFSSLELGSSLALDAGFQHLQLHAAHGYLVSLLIDQRLFDRAEDVLSRIARWAEQCAAARAEVSIRVSILSGDSTLDGQEPQRHLSRVASLPVNYIDVSSGFYDIDKQLIYPSRPDILVARRDSTLSLANEHRQASFIYSGRAFLYPVNSLPPNVHIGLCRDLIANPDYLSTLSKGCENAGKCHYHSRGAPHVTCARWNEVLP